MASFDDFLDRLGSVAPAAIATATLTQLGTTEKGEEPTFLQRLSTRLAGALAASPVPSSPVPAPTAIPVVQKTGTVATAAAGVAPAASSMLPIGLLLAGGIGLVFLLR